LKITQIYRQTFHELTVHSPSIKEFWPINCLQKFTRKVPRIKVCCTIHQQANSRAVNLWTGQLAEKTSCG